MRRGIRVVGLCVISLFVGGAVGPVRTPAQSAALPQFGHVVIVVGENQAYGTTYNSSNMPYLTSLANHYGLATHYWSDSHPSIGNYFALSAGQLFTTDDALTPKSLPLSSDNIAFELQQANKTWKDYVENLPRAKGCGGLVNGKYHVRHDPLEYFTDINTERANYVCFSQFATDLKNTALPNLSWLVPNGYDDAHDSNAAAFDSWLQAEIPPLLQSSYFQPGGDGLLIITWDEDNDSGTPDCSTTTLGQGCGGQVETVLVSPYSKPAYKSTAGDNTNYSGTYDAANILSTIAQGLGVTTSGLGGAASRVAMADFFNTSASGSVFLSTTSLNFGNVTGNQSTSLPVTLNNSTDSSVSVSGIGISPPTSGFTQNSNCPPSLGAGTNCMITVTFTPTNTGTTGSATLSVTTGASTLTASLSGTGVHQH